MRGRTAEADDRWDSHARDLGFVSERQLWYTVFGSICVAELADLFGYSLVTIRSRMRRCGLSLRRGNYGRYRDSFWDRVAVENGFSSEKEMWKTIYPTTFTFELAAMFDVSTITILNRVKKCGIKRRPRGGRNHVKRRIT